MKFEHLIEKARKIVPSIDKRDRCKHISFLLDGQKIVSCGKNCSRKSHPIGKLNDSIFNGTHAELSAIIKTRWRIDKLSKLTLVNLRFLKNGKIANSRPCKSCQKMLKSFGIKKIWYSTTEGFEKYEEN